MIDQVIGYTIIIILFAAIMFQQQLTVASPKYSTELPVNGNTTEPTSEPASIPEEQPNNDDVVHCAALGCPDNPPNPHGPPTEEPEGDE